MCSIPDLDMMDYLALKDRTITEQTRGNWISLGCGLEWFSSSLKVSARSDFNFLHQHFWSTLTACVRGDFNVLRQRCLSPLSVCLGIYLSFFRQRFPSAFFVNFDCLSTCQLFQHISIMCFVDFDCLCAFRRCQLSDGGKGNDQRKSKHFLQAHHPCRYAVFAYA